MTYFVVPTSFARDFADYRQTTVIDGREYILRFHWNQRIGTWFLDISDQDNSMIVAGLAVVLGYRLLINAPDARLPPGDLFVVDRTDKGLQPNIDELGVRVGLAYNDLQDA